MIAELKSIGALPDFQIKRHWDVLRLWQVSDLRIEKNKPDAQLLSVFLNRGVIRYGEGGGQVHKPGHDLSVYQVVKRGDLVLNNQQAWRGSVGVSRYDGIISPAYVVLRLREAIMPRFGDYLFQSRVMVDQYVTSSKGVGDIQRDAYLAWLKNVKVPVPPTDEQELIVRFLDWASVRLGKAIAAKRKVIGLLEEQKQAIIHRAVTRGLDDTVPLKPSGQEWIEEYPAHWHLKPNRSLMQIRKELVGAKANEYKVLSLTKRGVIVRDMDAGGKYLSFLDRAQVVRHGDLVFCLFDVDETPRAVGLSRFDGMISPDYTVMECTDQLTASFLECFYIAIDDRKMLRPLYTGLRKRISKPLFRAAKTPIPPESEINAILSYITTATSELDRSSDCLSRQIKYVQEYRTRLIADVVTGKLDVRDFARKLPIDIAEEAAELSSELVDDEFSDNDDELADELAGDPA